MTSRYFAYGSNLNTSRMQGRVPSAAPIGVAQLPGYRLTWDKLGADGSGKANIAAASESTVWGVVYTLDPDEWPRLDACEPGYKRGEIGVSLQRESVVCLTYRAPGHPAAPRPSATYLDLILEGARQHGLPGEYIRWLAATTFRSDKATR